MSTGDLYTGCEQTFIKHFILRNYLERFAIIVGSRWDTLTYIDCFSGPWKAKSEKFEDSSFSIAIEQLRKARHVHKKRNGATLKLRCFFLEKTPSAYTMLKQFAERIDDVKIETKKQEARRCHPGHLEFCTRGWPYFVSFHIHRSYWMSEFTLETITQLLRLNPGEVLITFMTEHIRRFIESPQTQESFIQMFGSGQFKDKLNGLDEKDREDAIVTGYSECVKRIGAYGYTSSAIVLHPKKNRTHFHLIYATRDLRGIQVFKESEKRAMPVMEKTRDETQKREREEGTGQTELVLFSGAATQDPSAYFRSLRERYVFHARAEVLTLVQTKKQLTYDETWASAIQWTPPSRH